MVKGNEFHGIIEGIFSDIVGIHQSSQLRVNCPRCQEREGLSYPDGKYNLEISTEKRQFHCWRCEPKFAGSLKWLIKLYGSKSDYEIYQSYAAIYGDEEYEYDEEKDIPVVKLPEEMILFSEMDETNSQHFEAYNYLVNDRKISREIILKYRLGFCVEGKYINRIIIPSFGVNGVVDYFVARSYDKKEKKYKYLNPPLDKNIFIFNEGYINWDTTIYLVEGVTDMFSVPNAIPMLGKTISTKLFMKLKELMPQIIILLDPDAYKSSIELFYTLQTIYVGCEDRVKIVKLPTNEDVDELRRNKGMDEVIKALYGARELITDDYFINKLQKPYDKQAGRYNSNSKYFEWKSGSTRTFI